MFLSFIVPVYNAEHYLPDCLDSLLKQDLPHEEYEIICVNDGSKDGSLSVLKDYQSRFPSIVIIDKENGGVTTARNAGLSAARGDYIWYVDSDDLVKPNVLGMLCSKAEATGCDRLAVGGYEFTDTFTQEETELSQKGALPVNTSWYDAVVWRNLLRRAFLLENDLFFRYPDITHGEDGLYMYEVVIANPSFAEIEEALYFYRVHSGSAETAVSFENQKKKLRSYIRVTQILQDYYQSGQKNSFTANKLMSFLWFALHASASLPPKDARAALNSLKSQGLYPYSRPAECTLTQSYMADITTPIGKVYDKIYLHLHTRRGFAAMFLLQQLLQLKRKIIK